MGGVGVGEVAREDVVEFDDAEAEQEEGGDGGPGGGDGEEGRDGQCEPPEAEGEDGGGEVEAEEFIFGFDGRRIFPAEDAEVVYSGEEGEGDSDTDGEGDEGRLEVREVESWGGVDYREGGGEEVDYAVDGGAHDGGEEDDGFGEEEAEWEGL